MSHTHVTHILTYIYIYIHRPIYSKHIEHCTYWHVYIQYIHSLWGLWSQEACLFWRCLKKTQIPVHVFCLNVGASGLASPSSVLTVFVRASAKSHMSKWCVFYTWRSTAVRKLFCKYQAISWTRPVRTAKFMRIYIYKNKSMPIHLNKLRSRPTWHCWAWNSFCRASLPQAWAQPVSNSCSQRKVRCLPVCCTLCKKEMADTDNPIPLVSVYQN